jgi:hypothetical protein
VCSTGCPTQNHTTFGECLRAKNLQVADVAAHKFNTNQIKEINNYVDARKSGMQPASVSKKDVDFARAATDKTGVPYRADA